MSDYDDLLIKYQELEKNYNTKVEEFEQYKGNYKIKIIS